MDTAAASQGVTLTIPCPVCGTHRVILSLLTSYGSYHRCEACGHAWHLERLKGSEDSNKPGASAG